MLPQLSVQLTYTRAAFITRLFQLLYGSSNWIAFDYSWWPTYVYLYRKPNNKNVILNVAIITLLCWSTEIPSVCLQPPLVSGQHKQQGLQGNKRNQIFCCWVRGASPGPQLAFWEKDFCGQRCSFGDTVRLCLSRPACSVVSAPNTALYPLQSGHLAVVSEHLGLSLWAKYTRARARAHTHTHTQHNVYFSLPKIN